MLAAAIVAIQCAPGEARAQTTTADSVRWRGPESLAVTVDTLSVAPGAIRLDLRRAPVLELFEVRSGAERLREGLHFTLLAERGVLVLNASADQERRIVVRYRYDATRLPAFLALREERSSIDTTRTTPSPRITAPLDLDAPPPPGFLHIAGSKTVSVQGGSNRDATVDQGLNLSIHGRLTETIGVRAEISDENLPITPEGNTEELRDLDQVSIEIFGPRGRARLGDFRVEQALGRFVPYQRKLQGIDLEVRDARGRVEVLGGAPQGRRIEVEIRGREGVQGPYELLSGLRLDQSFIVAGSERVWVDGELVVRGETNDYTIDYIRGTIRFTPRLPVSPDRRIAVDFETSATGYRRNVAGARVDSLQVGPVRLGFALLREADDPDRPRDRSLEEDELALLAVAGDDPQLARSSGVRATAPGEGDYVERFTGTGVRYFEAADSSGGDFDVDFLFVGVGNGEYELEGVTAEGVLRFRFVDAGAGDYTVGRLLPLPDLTDVMVAKLDWGDSLRGEVSAELDLSSYDRNRLSEIDDGDNDGAAWSVVARSPRWRRGDDAALRLHARSERIERDFRALGRLRAPFFYESWNLQDEARTVDESFHEVAGEALLRERRVSVGWARLERAGLYRGQRWSSAGGGPLLGPLRWRHAVSATRAQRESPGEAVAERDSRRDDRVLRLQWGERGFVPFVERIDENFEDRRVLRAVGLRSAAWVFGVDAGPRAHLHWRTEEADSLQTDGAAWTFARAVETVRGRTAVGGGRARLDLDATWRRATLPGDLRETTRLAQSQLALRDPERGVQLDLGYRVSNDQSRVLGRQVVFVGFDQGDFDLEGRPVGVNQGDYDVVYTPSDSLLTSTQVELDVRFELQPSTDRLGGFSNSLLWQVSERSRTDEVGRLLRLDGGILRDPDTTVFGEQRLREELVLLRRVRRFDLRLGHERRDALDQRFTQGPERTAQRRNDLRAESELTEQFSLRVDAATEARERASSDQVNPLLRGYEVRDRTTAATLRWRPARGLRVELESRWTGREERIAGIEQTVLALAPSSDASLVGLRLTVQARLAAVEETGGDDRTRPFFFERPGTQRSFNTLLQWGGAGSFTVGVRYQLRDEPGRPVRHDLGVETRARF